jgi:UDP-glucose 6-dehydrogenase
LIEELKLGVVRSGYVGLTTEACLTHLEHQRGVDKDE